MELSTPAAISMVGAVTVTLPASDSTMLPCALTDAARIDKDAAARRADQRADARHRGGPVLVVDEVRADGKAKPVVHGGQDAVAVGGRGWSA